ncbi:MAG: lipoate protein ligase C-terminal domain-containing protein [Nitrososphaeria archaeon]
MMHLEMDKKIVGGKYVKVELDVENGAIKNALISGDFFAFPIEEFEKFLNALKGIKFNVEEIENIFEQYAKKIVFSGIGVNDLKEIFLLLLKEMA